MFRLNARGQQTACPIDTPAVAALTPKPAAPVARPVAPALTVEPLRVALNAMRKLLRAVNLSVALVVKSPVRLTNKSWLRKLPTSLECTHLDLSDCTNLNVLSGHLRATSVHAAHTAMREIPGDWLVRKHLDLSVNPQLVRLAKHLTACSLNVGTCPRLLTLPAGLRVQMYWQVTTMDERTAFRSEELRATDLLQVHSVTHRRILLEGFGLDCFMHEVSNLVHEVVEAGGEYQLLNVPLPNNEPLHMLRVNCPSTAHVYMLRVPPQVRSYRRAAA